MPGVLAEVGDTLEQDPAYSPHPARIQHQDQASRFN
jgi:hypothetical protein